jgi:hypothetical protein
MSRKLNWKITIEELDAGRVITVGCKKIAFDGPINVMLERLRKLYDNPMAMYKEWFPDDFTEPVPPLNRTPEVDNIPADVDKAVEGISTRNIPHGRL